MFFATLAIVSNLSLLQTGHLNHVFFSEFFLCLCASSLSTKNSHIPGTVTDKSFMYGINSIPGNRGLHLGQYSFLHAFFEFNADAFLLNTYPQVLCCISISLLHPLYLEIGTKSVPYFATNRFSKIS